MHFALTRDNMIISRETSLRRIISKIEDKIKIDDFVVDDGTNIWPLIRNLLADELLHQDTKVFSEKLAKHKKRRTSFLFRLILDLLKIFLFRLLDFRNNCKVKKADFIIYQNNGNRIPLNGKFFDRYFDPLIEVMHKEKRDIVGLEDITLFPVKHPRAHKTTIIGASLRICGIMARIKPLVSLNWVLRNQSIGLIFDELQNQSIKLSSFNQNALYFHINTFMHFKKKFLKYLRRVKPKVGFLICYYGPRGMAFCAACKELGIKSIDIQHGIAGESNSAYSNWAKIPKDGYALLPRYFWSWSKEDVNAIKAWNYGKENFHDAFQGPKIWIQYLKVNSHKYFKNEVERARSIREDNKDFLHILVTLQTSVRLPDWFSKTINDRSLKIFWWVRKHPISDETQDLFIRKIENNKVNVDFASTAPLTIILNHVDFHVTSHSAVVYEALDFKKPSIVFSGLGSEIFKTEIALGKVGVVGGKEGFLSAVSNQQSIILQIEDDPKEKSLSEIIKFLNP